MRRRSRRRWFGVLALVCLLLVLLPVGTALAGPPGQDPEETEQPQGGTLPDGSVEPEGGWTEYPAMGAGGAGEESSGDGLNSDPPPPPGTWPKPSRGIFAWLFDLLNPGKWVANTIIGALAGVLRIFAGLAAQPVYWLAGYSYENPYDDCRNPYAECRVVQGMNIVTQTDLSLFDNPLSPIGSMYRRIKPGALAFLGVIILWVALREMIRLNTGQSHGFRHVFSSGWRVVVAVIFAAGGAWWLGRTLIEMNNVMISGLLSADLVNDFFGAINYAGVSDALMGLGLVLETALTLVVFIFVMLCLAIIMMGRYVLLAMVMVLSPLAAVSYATEETEFFFRKWMQVLISATFYQFVSMAFLTLASRLMVAGWSNTTGGNPVLLVALSTVAVLMTILGPPILNFSIGRIAGTGQRAVTRVIATVS